MKIAHRISALIADAYGKGKISRRIQCTLLKNAKSLNIKDLQDTKKGAYKPAYKKFQKTAENQLLDVPAEVAEIVALWPELPEYIKAAIKALVQTYTKEC